MSTDSTKFDLDLFTIGGGSGGVRASRASAAYGAKVAIAEAGKLGGACVNVGCIPKKLLAYASAFADEFDVASSFGWSVDGRSFDWARLIACKNKEVGRLNGVYERLLHEAGVQIVAGRARLVDAHTVEVAGKTYTARTILIATGASPSRPAIPGAELGVTSDEAFDLERLPRSALVVGGGYIALEFASIFNGLGVATTLAYRGGRLLRGFDHDLGARVAEAMAGKGVRIWLDSEPSSLSRADEGGKITARFGCGNVEDFDLVLFATGRRPNIDGLGVESVGVAVTGEGALRVDEFSQSSVPSIYAIGDVTNRVCLTPVATADAMCLARTLFGAQPSPVDHACVPTAVFSNPNVATVGLPEQRARELLEGVDVFKTSFRSLKHVVTDEPDRVFVKLVVDRKTRKVVGAHMVGHDAGEILQGMAIAVKMGATKEQFDATIGIHPTVAEEFVTLRG